MCAIGRDRHVLHTPLASVCTQFPGRLQTLADISEDQRSSSETVPLSDTPGTSAGLLQCV